MISFSFLQRCQLRALARACWTETYRPLVSLVEARHRIGIRMIVLLVALASGWDLFLCAKHLFVCPYRGSQMSNGTS